MLVTSDQADAPRKRGGQAKRWQKGLKLTGAAFALMIWTLLALFEFDLRCLSGFNLSAAFEGNEICMITDESLLEDRLREIYTSNRGTVMEVLRPPGVPCDTVVSGPTIFRFQSGRLIFTHGAYIEHLADGQIRVYAQ